MSGIVKELYKEILKNGAVYEKIFIHGLGRVILVKYENGDESALLYNHKPLFDFLNRYIQDEK